MVQSWDGLVSSVEHVVRRSQASCRAVEMLFRKQDSKCESSSQSSYGLDGEAPEAVVNP